MQLTILKAMHLRHLLNNSLPLFDLVFLNITNFLLYKLLKFLFLCKLAGIDSRPNITELCSFFNICDFSECLRSLY